MMFLFDSVRGGGALEVANPVLILRVVRGAASCATFHGATTSKWFAVVIAARGAS